MAEETYEFHLWTPGGAIFQVTPEGTSWWGDPEKLAERLCDMTGLKVTVKKTETVTWEPRK